MSLDWISGIAVDIGGTKTAAARIVGGRVVEKTTQPTDGGADLPAYLDGIGEMIRQLGWRQGGGDRLGVTVTGRISAQGSWSAVNAGTLRCIEDAPLGAALIARFGPVSWSNDAAAAALAEYLAGAHRGNFVYITVSTGVGGGLVLNGRLVDSNSGLAGHLGFSTSRLASDLCGCGRTGTVESIASGCAIAHAADKAGHPGMDARGVFQALRDGADWAEAIVDRSAQAIAELCGNITAIFDPDAIAIGGSVGLADGYITRVNAYLGQEPALFCRPVRAARLGADGPLLGALAHGMEGKA